MVNTDIINIEKKENVKVPVLISEYADLIKLDNELNSCPYYLSLISNIEDKEEFIRFYSNASINEGIIDLAIGKYFDISFYARLMLKDKKSKLTATKLENSVFVIALPIGKKQTGEITYHFAEYAITNEDKVNISNKTKGKLKSDTTKEERFNYFEDVVMNYVKDMRSGLSKLSDSSNLPLAKEAKTWDLFESEFKNKYGYEPDKFDSITWNIYTKKRFDARDVDSKGHILPLIVQYHEQLMITYKPTIDENIKENSELDEYIEEEYVEQPYELGDNKFINTDIDNKYIIEPEEVKEEPKNRFINEYSSKFFKPSEILDKDETERQIPLSYSMILANNKTNNIDTSKKYKLNSSISFNQKAKIKLQHSIPFDKGVPVK